MNSAVQNFFLKRLESHIKNNKLASCFVSYHGGEPLLMGLNSMARLTEGIRKVADCTGADIRIGITTNALLIDERWADFFSGNKIVPTVSIDGPRRIHDKHRVDRLGHGSFERVLSAVRLLLRAGLTPGVLAVANPITEPYEVTDLLVNELGIKRFDILMPDYHHGDEGVVDISEYYIKLFDAWYSGRLGSDVCIRTIDNIVRGLLGAPSRSESLGYGPVQNASIATDGTIEPLDVLRISGDGHNNSGVNVDQSELQEVVNNVVWKTAYEASLRLPRVCRECRFLKACGGGYLPHRWSHINGYDNASVYCESLKKIFTHVQTVISNDLVSVGGIQ